MLILDLLLGVALFGTLTSTIFLLLTILGFCRFLWQKRQAKRVEAKITEFPPVSLLKPVHGLEAQLKENIESFFRQDYPHYEILFAAEDPEDEALSVIREVSARYPDISCRILLTGTPPWPNPPAYSFHLLADLAQYEILVTSDSDVEVTPNYLREVVAPLLDPKVGMVTCVYRGKNAAGFWSSLTAIGMSVEMTAGVLVVNLLEGIKFGLGPTIAVKKQALKRIGGYQVAAEYFRQRLRDWPIDRPSWLSCRLVSSRHQTHRQSKVLRENVGQPVAVGQIHALFPAQGSLGQRSDLRHTLWSARFCHCIINGQATS